MDEKNTTEYGWSSVEKWHAEMVQQAHVNARRWFLISLILLAALVATNAYWIYIMNSYEYVYQNGSGQNNYNNNVDGDVENVATGEEEEER